MKKYINNISVALFAFLCFGAFAQQEIQYTQFMFNKLAFNPAYAGSKGNISALVMYRNQWVGLDGAPWQIGGNIHGAVGKKKNLGIGLNMVHDRLGLFQNSALDISLAYHIHFKNEHQLSVGIQGEFAVWNIRWDKSKARDSGDEVIPYSVQNSFVGNAGVGLYYTNKWMYIGASAPRLVPNRFIAKSASEISKAKIFHHAYFMAGAKIPLAKNFDLMPNFMYKFAQNSPPDFDANLGLLIYNTVQIGASYRYNNSFGAMAQVYIKEFMKLGYAYDFNSTKMRTTQAGSHECFVGFDFGKKCTKAGVASTRYF